MNDDSTGRQSIDKVEAEIMQEQQEFGEIDNPEIEDVDTLHKIATGHKNEQPADALVGEHSAHSHIEAEEDDTPGSS